MPDFEPPGQFPFDSPSRWPEWRARFGRFRKATKLHKDDGETQVSALIYAMGPQAEGVYNSFKFDDPPDPTEEHPHPVDPKDDFDAVLRMFDDYFVPKRNTIYDRAQFYQRGQEPGESIECFVRHLRELAAHCGFGTKEDENIRDRLIVGMLDKGVAHKLQMEQDNLTLEKAVELARHSELVKSQNEEGVNVVRRDRRMKPHFQSSQRSHFQSSQRSSSSRGRGQGQSRQPASQDRSKQSSGPAKPKCGQCGYVHRSKNLDACPARGKTCNKCGGKGHFQAMCRTVQEVSYEAVEQSCPPETYFCGSVSCDDSAPPWKVDLHLNASRVPTTFKLDSGADVSVMSLQNYKRLKPKPALKPANAILTSPGGPLECHGQFIARSPVDGTMYHFRVVVVAHDVDNLLSRGAASRMGLISKLNMVMEDIGCLKTDPVKIALKDGAEPFAVNVARRVPIPILARVKEELDRLTSAGIIKEITKPTPWCAPMVPVMKKSGKVRLCVDLKKLNVNVRRERYVLPTLDDLTSRLAGSTVYSSLDAASGFYQIPLDEASQGLTTFITPFGRYCFRRLPFGITSAPEIFMRKMSELLAGTEGVFAFMDDILVFGKDEREHDKRLNIVLQTLRKAGLTLNPEKCLYRQQELKFLGHKFTRDGVVADPDKVAAIQDMPSPTSVTQLRQVLGMIHYLGSYLPDLHVTTRPLNDLLKKDDVWSWDAQQEAAFQRVKQLVSSTPKPPPEVPEVYSILRTGHITTSPPLRNLQRNPKAREDVFQFGNTSR